MNSESCLISPCQDSMISDIRNLKINQNLTLMQIADKMGSSYETVRKISHKEGIIHPRNIKQRLSSGDKLRFRFAYMSGDYTNEQLGNMFEISVPSVKRLAKKMNLPKKNSMEHPKRKQLMEQTAKLYKKGLSTFEIKKKLDIDDETVRGYLKKLGINRRCSNGLSKRKISMQNKIIKEMYLNGSKLEEIKNAVDLGTHGISNRLDLMNIIRSRNPYKPVGNIFDDDIKALYLAGKAINKIAAKFNITISAVSYRLKNHIFKWHSFKIKYYSELFNRWKKSSKTYSTLREVEFGKRRTRKYMGNNVKIRIEAIRQRIRPKFVDI